MTIYQRLKTTNIKLTNKRTNVDISYTTVLKEIIISKISNPQKRHLGVLLCIKFDKVE
jgi:hypothetical protein